MSLGNLGFHRPKVGRFLPIGSLRGAQQQSSLTPRKCLIERRRHLGQRTGNSSELSLNYTGRDVQYQLPY
jgi:hypothetical protein